MAYNNKTIYNPVIKQRIKFVHTSRDTKGAFLQMQATYGPNSIKPAPHYHPQQEEEFYVVSGAMTVDINGKIQTLQEGQSLHISSNTVHSMWNNSKMETVLLWKVRPALNTEQMLETLAGLASDGKTNKAGIPSLLQAALIGQKFSPVFRLAKPSFMAQKIVFGLLSTVAYLLGYKPVYKKYID